MNLKKKIVCLILGHNYPNKFPLDKGYFEQCVRCHNIRRRID